MTETIMTIKEIAEVLGVTPEAIKWHVRDLYPDLMQNGVTTYLTDEQVTEIKRKMQPTSLVVGSSTDLEMQEKGLQFIEWMRAKIEVQKRLLEDAQPKIEFHDTIVESEKKYDFSETVKVLHLTIGRNKFMALLRADKILNTHNEPYQEFVSAGYFFVTIKNQDHLDHSLIVTLVTGKGLVWLSKRYNHIRLKEVI